MQSLLPQPPANLQRLPLAHVSALRSALLSWTKLCPVLLNDVLCSHSTGLQFSALRAYLMSPLNKVATFGEGNGQCRWLGRVKPSELNGECSKCPSAQSLQP